jgi:uncharacterized RDD family membrane protein YckC
VNGSAELPANAPRPAKRAAATSVDCLVLYIPYVATLTDYSEPVRLVWAGIGAAVLLIQARLLARRGQTLGKILLRQRVVRRSTGENAGLLVNAVLRPLAAWAPNVLFLAARSFPVWIVADGLTLIWRRDGLSLHDLLCGTRVVEE